MGEKSSGRIAAGAGAAAALATVGALFAGAGLVGGGVSSFDLWPDWTGSPRPSVEVAARSPNGPGVNPLLPLAPRADGFRSLGSATAALVVGPTAFSAGPDVATAGVVAAVDPFPRLTVAPASGASSPAGRGLDGFSSPIAGVDIPRPGAPAAPADRPAPAPQTPSTPIPAAQPVRKPSGPVAPSPAAREQLARAPARNQSSLRPPSSSGSGSGSGSTAPAGGSDSGPRPVTGRDAATSSTSPPSSGSASGNRSRRTPDKHPSTAPEPAQPPPPPAASSSSSGGEPARVAEPTPAPSQGAQGPSAAGSSGDGPRPVSQGSGGSP